MLLRRSALLATLSLGALGACAADPPPDVALEDETAALGDPDLARLPDPARELVITDPSVIRAPLETTFDPLAPSGTSPAGAWSFGRLVHNMLPASERGSAVAASHLVMDWLRTWEEAQAPNPAVSPALARAAVRLAIITPWKAASGCADPASPATDDACVLDLGKAPFRLMAIVNRPDLRVVSDGPEATGGEGRFVFQLTAPTLGVNATTGALEIMDPTVRPQKFTVIFEYALPLSGGLDAGRWARRWHQLGRLPFGAAYNALLRGITGDFSGPDRAPERPNGNALDQLRTNEVALMGARFPAAGFVGAKQFWELREFHLTTAGLEPHTVNLEPSRDFDVLRPLSVGTEGTRTAELGAFLNASADAVLASHFALPAGMSGNSALVGSSPYGAWGKLLNPSLPSRPAQGSPNDLGVAIPVRDAFAINTCAGCHRHETDTAHFMHVTFVGAMEPADRTDDRARAGVAPGTPDDVVVLSHFLASEIAPGGPRFADFVEVMNTPRSALRNARGLRACAPGTP